LLRPLFAIENQAREASASERLEIRQKQSVPVLAELRQKLLVWKEQLIPQHPMADAVNYILNHWTELNVFCSDGAVPIDNNVSTAARGSAYKMPTAGLCRVRQSA
jgi:transposase